MVGAAKSVGAEILDPLGATVSGHAPLGPQSKAFPQPFNKISGEARSSRTRIATNFIVSFILRTSPFKYSATWMPVVVRA